MKSVFRKIRLVFFSALVSTNVFSQNDMSSFLKVGIDDGNKVLSAYATPIFKTNAMPIKIRTKGSNHCMI
jgi:hypothetical protein